MFMHVDCSEDDSVKFISLMDQYGLKQHEEGMTHAREALDLIITKESGRLFGDFRECQLLTCVILWESYLMTIALLRIFYATSITVTCALI